MVLNNTSLTIQDFISVIDEDRILKETRSAKIVSQRQFCMVGVRNPFAD
ncbi:MAG: hypothetical protein WBZ20_16760 [Nitrososphaeraceae archaeon]